MESLLLTIAGTLIAILLAIIGYFLTNLHNRFEEHLKDSAGSEIRFLELKGDVRVLQAQQMDMRADIHRIEDKIDALPQVIIDLHNSTSGKMRSRLGDSEKG